MIHILSWIWISVWFRVTIIFKIITLCLEYWYVWALLTLYFLSQPSNIRWPDVQSIPQVLDPTKPCFWGYPPALHVQSSHSVSLGIGRCVIRRIWARNSSVCLLQALHSKKNFSVGTRTNIIVWLWVSFCHDGSGPFEKLKN